MNPAVRLNVIGEGPTEETFVRDILAPHLAPLGIVAVGRSIETSRKKGRIRRGGVTNYTKAKNDIVRWLKRDSTAYVTTMLDLYGLPTSFPSSSVVSQESDPIKAAQAIEAGLTEDISNQRFLPYIQLHEFEALLFASPEITDAVLYPMDGVRQLRALQEIRNAFATPEHINNSPATAPSKRILGMYTSYNKPLHGTRIIQKIGLQHIRSECPHFSDWLTRIEALAS